MVSIDKDSNNNTTIVGDGNVINPQKEKGELPYVSKTYRKYIIELEPLFLAMGVLFICIILNFSLKAMGIALLIIMAVWFFAPWIWMERYDPYVDVYNDHLVISGKKIPYGLLTDFGYDGRFTFTYAGANMDKDEKIICSSPNKAKFIYKTVQRYCAYNDTLIR
jgi:hypothetical protein